MNRSEIINTYIARYNLSSYLEIGIFDGSNFQSIKCKYKDSVDPGIEGVLPNWVSYKMTSDKFFQLIEKTDKKYDFVFIDGLHITDQVDKDIFNSLKHLNENGFIMLHDGNPPDYNTQAVPRKQMTWTGDVWKSVVKIRYNHPELSFFTIDADYGCVIIQKEKSKLYNKIPFETALEWDYFKDNKKELLNLISVSEFLEIINNK